MRVTKFFLIAALATGNLRSWTLGRSEYGTFLKGGRSWCNAWRSTPCCGMIKNWEKNLCPADLIKRNMFCRESKSFELMWNRLDSRLSTRIHIVHNHHYNKEKHPSHRNSHRSVSFCSFDIHLVTEQREHAECLQSSVVGFQERIRRLQWKLLAWKRRYTQLLGRTSISTLRLCLPGVCCISVSGDLPMVLRCRRFDIQLLYLSFHVWRECNRRWNMHINVLNLW